MRHLNVRQALSGVFFWAALWCVTTAASAGPSAVSLETLEGTPATLEQFTGQGQWLVVKIWASTCHVCNETAHEMVALSRQRKDNLQVLGIAVDGHHNRPGVLAFIERHALNYPTLLDDGRGAADIYRRGVGRDWGGWTPTFLIYSPTGQLVAQNVGAVAASDVMRFVDSYQAEAQH